MYIVFSDLDGTILDDHDYSYQDSLPGIESLKYLNIPLILVSSKTHAEMLIIRQNLGLNTPFVFENGGGIADLPMENNSITLLGSGIESLQSYSRLLRDMIHAPVHFMHEMSIPQIMEITGLSRTEVKQAQYRLTSLPFILADGRLLSPGELLPINLELQNHQLTVSLGKKFMHLHSSMTNKGNAIEILINHYQNAFQSQIVSIGIGDSLLDLPMLKKTTISFLVQNIPCDIPHIQYTHKSGPAGFSESIKHVLNTVAT